jgi:CDP-diacylglycerol--glycerol-3-phosphate 3-phosphatidyltransferase
VNLPNALTAGRIAASPLVALLPFFGSWQLKATGFVVFTLVAVTDYYDGKLARSRGLVTDLGKLLDPLADKVLLVAAFIPMYWLTASGGSWSFFSPHTEPFVAGVVGPVLRGELTPRAAYPFTTPFGLIGIPWWVLVVVIGRELFMTYFRQAAARRGVVVAAIGPAKWKTGLQWVWVGASLFWFASAAAAGSHLWRASWWVAFANFNGIVGVFAMIGAVILTVYTQALYLRRYSSVLRAPAPSR